MAQELTELERTKMENFALRQQLMQQQFRQNVLDRQAFIAEIERGHPGYTWNDQTGVLDPAPNGAAAVGLEAVANGEAAGPA